MPCNTSSDSGVWSRVTKTHLTPRIVCDTMTWKTEGLVSLSHTGSIGQWKRAFEYGTNMEVVVTGFWRKAVVKEPHISDYDQDNAQVSTKHVSKNP